MSKSHGEHCFHVQATWVTYNQYDSVAHTTQAEGSPRILRGLKEIQDSSLVFNHKIFVNFFHRKRHVQAKQKGVQVLLKRGEIESLLRHEEELHQDLNDILLQKELFWFQKSWEKWVKFGDRYSTFFHFQTIVRKKRNKIHGLFLDDGTQNTKPKVLRQEVNRYSRNLFSNDDISLFSFSQDLDPPSYLMRLGNLLLSQP